MHEKDKHQRLPHKRVPVQKKQLSEKILRMFLDGRALQTW